MSRGGNGANGARRATVAARDVALDSMIEERDHLRIRLSLIEDPDAATRGSIAETRSAIAELDRRIAARHREADAVPARRRGNGA